MATNNSTGGAQCAISNKAFPDEERVAIALDATAQILEIFAALLKGEGEIPIAAPLLKAIALRGRNLSRTAICALDDTVAIVDDLRMEVDHG